MTNKYTVLLVEDEKNIAGVICTLLETNGYRAIVAKDAREGKTLYSSYNPDLVILDLGLPDADGAEVLLAIREHELTPVIVLSARGDESEKVRLLDNGANDYITKPFGAAELLARVRNALRSHRHAPEEGRFPGGVFRLEDLCIDYDARRVFIGENEVKLTATEYNILALWSEYAGKMMTYSAIIKAIWHEPTSETSIKKLQVNMANIRKKFATPIGGQGYIVNELGVGYRMRSELV